MEIKKKLENEKNIDLQCYRNNVGDIFFTNIMRCRPHILIKKNKKFVCKKINGISLEIGCYIIEKHNKFIKKIENK